MLQRQFAHEAEGSTRAMEPRVFLGEDSESAMQTEAWLVYCGYLTWLLAGLGDFLCHRRTDLPHTSGVAESAMHLLQLGIVGSGLTLGLVFSPGRTLLLVLGACVVVHAVVGFLDTRIAFRRRRVVLPIEQHLHSVLDIAPIAALAWFATQAWPGLADGDWGVRLRSPAAPFQAWVAVYLPAAVLCVMPALMEFVAAFRRDRRTIEEARAG
jgi:hypothetical protein